MAESKKQLSTHQFLYRSFKKSLVIFLKETGLHGLKFVGDAKLSNWERLFFLCSFVAAFVMTCQLITNIYIKWESTPVIIGISPHATSILKVPFPAITICNMNQVLRSKVDIYQQDSKEGALLKLLCNEESDEFEDDSSPFASNLRNNTLQISEFVAANSQPCEQMLLYCRFSSIQYDCMDLFRSIITDEGLCCVFNFLPPEFLYKTHLKSTRNLTNRIGFVPVQWNPETGYPNVLPEKYYPRAAIGPGISLGFTVVMDAQLNEYYCSSTNGPGFKVFFHNPIEVPSVKEAGLITAIGHETNYRIEVSRGEAVSAIRSISRDRRQCVFRNEQILLFYEIYTRRNCENECLAMYLFESCSCLPFDYPKIYENASICLMRDTFCVKQAQRSAMRPNWAKCRKLCLPSCFDLTYMASSFPFPLASRNFKMANPLVGNMSKVYLRDNIAVMNVYYRESVYYGNMKNVYIGLTEFLSNIGGVMGLFMGFSVISLAEIFYFLILKPLTELLSWKRSSTQIAEIKHRAFELENKPKLWHTRELYPKGLKM
ncbi:pickpocket protein 28 [Drosophila tropicalis]|uniref:pickpocket protein 28 n=1 Tax=Drosophila tropicalis TaxID=46794 RepID=UPI0035AC0124